MKLEVDVDQSFQKPSIQEEQVSKKIARREREDEREERIQISI